MRFAVRSPLRCPASGDRPEPSLVHGERKSITGARTLLRPPQRA